MGRVHGIVSSLLSQSKNKMKFLLVVALLAGVQADAEPEADPQLLLYGGVGAVPHVPTVKVVETQPAEVKTTVNAVPHVLTHPGVVGYTGYTGLHYPYYPYYGLLPAAVPAAEAEAEAPAVEAERKKREAEAAPEADAEADPWLYYSGLHYPVTYTAPVVTTVKAAPVKTYSYTYSTLGYPYGLGYHGGLLGYHGYLGYPYLLPTVAAAKEEEEAPAVEAERKRREAEPEADPEADPAILASYSRVVSAPTPIIHAPAVAAAYSAPFTYAYGYRYPYAWGK